MKKFVYFIMFMALVLITLESFRSHGLSKKDGAAPGYTGSPGDTLKNCTYCHGGVAVDVNGWITSNIPAEGYTPNQTYTITAMNKELEATRFGFEISPQNMKGDLLGKMLITDSVRTKLVGLEKYITYTENGVEGKDSLFWSFNWIAPPKGTGNVIFYGGFNSNFDGHKEADKTFLSTLTVKEVGAGAISQKTELANGFRMYPNPANDVLNINLDLKTPGKAVIDIRDVNGKLVMHLLNEKLSGPLNKRINTSGLADGNYTVHLLVNGTSVSKKLNIVH